MGRTRGFDEVQVAHQAAAAFVSTGFEGTSIDDLVRATGLQRGSLYQAFGSKRGMFLAALRHIAAGPGSRPGHPGVPLEVSPATLDLLLVAVLELAPRDDEVRRTVAQAIADIDNPAHVLGDRLLQRASLQA